MPPDPRVVCRSVQPSSAIFHRPHTSLQSVQYLSTSSLRVNINVGFANIDAAQDCVKNPCRTLSPARITRAGWMTSLQSGTFQRHVGGSQDPLPVQIRRRGTCPDDRGGSTSSSNSAPCCVLAWMAGNHRARMPIPTQTHTNKCSKRLLRAIWTEQMSERTWKSYASHRVWKTRGNVADVTLTSRKTIHPVCCCRKPPNPRDLCVDVCLFF